MLNSMSWRPKGAVLAASVLLWIFAAQMTGLYLFTSGFLLTRMALPNTSSCTEASCRIEPTHQKLVLLIIDALRFDFVSPDPPHPTSPYYHNVLTLPRELTAQHPERSFIYHSFADPPTTTLQRIKGITTGSLPTFVDIGNSFGGSAVDEDSLIHQLASAGKKVAFMGDDTWMTVFPTLFEANMTYPYDSFNVEDLHTVDEGVMRHLFPLLQKDSQSSWDVIIGHFLGVDHVAHRVGPDHPTMKAKLAQMDDVLRRVVDALEDDTLLVVLGDHGMDRKGDHGGDDVYETAAALWLYSKGAALRDPLVRIHPDLLPRELYPEATVPHRFIQQIDIVPTIALLLGIPIPFNNLGTVIPEPFARSSLLESALDLNRQQINRYLSEYRESSNGGELGAYWSDIETAWAQARSAHEPSSSHNFMRLVLKTCRSLWAQFDGVQMSLGLASLTLSSIAVGCLYFRLGGISDWEGWASKRINRLVRSSAFSVVTSIVIYAAAYRFLRSVGIVKLALASASFASSAIMLWDVSTSLRFPSMSSVPMVLILHIALFFSNSFTFWEERIIPFFLISLLVPSVRIGFTAADSRLRKRILFFSAIFAACVRLMAVSTVCREEQQPFCTVTFYASSGQSSPPIWALFLSLPFAIMLPSIMRRFLAISKSDKRLAPPLINFIDRPAMVANSLYWICEWAETVETLGPNVPSILRTVRTSLAWFVAIVILLGGLGLWWLDPRCFEVRSKTTTEDSQVAETKAEDGASSKTPQKTIVVINSNAYGAPYTLFLVLFFTLVYLATQPTGQLALALGFIALFSHLEIADSVRDARALEKAFSGPNLSAAMSADSFDVPTESFSFGQLMPIALLAIHAFHTTGHQSTLASLQWKTGFLFTSTLSPLLSPLSVTLNTAGPIFIFALASPLLACWQAINPRPGANVVSSTQILGESLRAGVGLMFYFGCLLVGAAGSAALLRRHLMVWKVFAPRFMMAAVDLIAVDVAVILGVLVGVERMRGFVGRLVEKTA